MKCTVCGFGSLDWSHDPLSTGPWHAFTPPVERKPRLTICCTGKSGGTRCYYEVRLDGVTIVDTCDNDPLPSMEEARAAAQAYVDELKAHFRAGHD